MSLVNSVSMAADSKIPKTQPPSAKGTNFATPGWSQVPTTSIFRITNFELFAKPNKVVMASGIAAFTGCLAYIVYMNMTDENSSKSYMSLKEDGSLIKRQRTSKWE